MNTGEDIEDTLQIHENITDTESIIKCETQSSEKENLDDVINQWLSDDSIDFELSGNDSVPTQQDTMHVTTAGTNFVASSNTVFTNSNLFNTGMTVTGLRSSEEKVISNRIFTQSKSPKAKKQRGTTCKKQMDIGVYFGLKPKQKVGGKAKDVSNNASDVLQQTSRQFDGGGKSNLRNKKCPFYKIVEGNNVYMVSKFNLHLSEDEVTHSDS